MAVRAVLDRYGSARHAVRAGNGLAYYAQGALAGSDSHGAPRGPNPHSRPGAAMGISDPRRLCDREAKARGASDGYRWRSPIPSRSFAKGALSAAVFPN